MKTIAFLWWENEVQWSKAEQPFNRDWKTQDYAKYTELGQKKDLDIYLGGYRWYKDGKMTKAWKWNGEGWEKKEDIELDGVYDLFRHDKEKLKLKKQMNDDVGIINHPELTDICQDKLKTYNLFQEHIPETVEYNEENLNQMLEKYGRIVLKPRFGSSGEGIRIISSKEELDGFQPETEYLVQKFMDTDGADWLNIEGPHDVRIFVINGEIAGSHVRTPEEGGLLSNNALGGDQRYVDIQNLPQSVENIVSKVDKELEQFEPSIYTVDFMFDHKDQPWIVELNSQPGIYYHQDVKDKEYELPMMKKVIKTIEKV